MTIGESTTRKSRLSTRITVSALVLVTLGALGLMFVEESRLHALYLSDRRAALEVAFKTNEMRLIQAVDTLRRDVRFLSEAPPIAGIARASFNDGIDPQEGNTRAQWDARLQEIFTAFLRAHPEYHQVSFIGVEDQGREIVRATSHAGRVEIVTNEGLQAKADRVYYGATLALQPGQVHLSQLGLHREWGRIETPQIRTIHASVPISDSDGNPFGLVVIGMHVGPLLQLVTAGLPPETAVYITDHEGRYLLHPDAGRAFEFEHGEAGGIHFDFPELGPMLEQGTTGIPSLQEMRVSTGKKFLAAGRIQFDPDNPSNFVLLAYHLTDDAARQTAAIPTAQIVGGFAALLAVCAIVFAALRRTFAPLDRIAAAAREIAAGNRDVHLPIGGGGEIGDLGNALDAMLDELSRRTREIAQINEGLERQVAERTDALTVVNEKLNGEIHERERLLHDTEMLLKQREVIIKTAQDGFWMTDMNGFLLEANETYAGISGYSIDELVGMHISQLEAKELSREEVLAHIEKIIAQRFDRFETLHRHKDGHIIDIEVSVTYLPEEEKMFAFCRDITERKQAEDEIRKLAFHDHLTGLPNRRLFLERFRTALSASERHRDYGAVLFIDLDNFKTLNDTYGHECGDRMLVEVANRIKACVREIDTASRFGGDEFTVLVEALGSEPGDAARKARLVAEKICEALARPYEIEGHPHDSSPSIGVCLYHGNRESLDTLMQWADTAMYRAKDSGRGKVCFCDLDDAPR